MNLLGGKDSSKTLSTPPESEVTQKLQKVNVDGAAQNNPSRTKMEHVDPMPVHDDGNENKEEIEEVSPRSPNAEPQCKVDYASEEQKQLPVEAEEQPQHEVAHASNQEPGDPDFKLRESHTDGVCAPQSRERNEDPRLTEDTPRNQREDQTDHHSSMTHTQHLHDSEDLRPAPVLSDDDEQFLQQATLDMEPVPSSRRATMIADNGDLVEEADAGDIMGSEENVRNNDVERAEDVPLPSVTAHEKEQLQDNFKERSKITKPQTWKERWNQWSFVPLSASGLSFKPPSNWGSQASKVASKAEDMYHSFDYSNLWQSRDKSKEKFPAAATLNGSNNGLTSAANEKQDNTDDERSKRDLISLLHSLDLSSINNRVVGISNDTQKLLESFNVVLKDVINGGPTAYHDLEKLLRDKETQLDKLFKNLPPFLQTLVKNIPTRMYAALAPQLAAAMAMEKRSGDANVNTIEEVSESEEIHVEGQKADKKAVKKKRSFIPTLKSLIGQKGAVVAMLRSIISFLEMRFPLFLTGTNVLMSLSVFILLFVFWYCHKRGKESRLESEGVPIDPSLDDLERNTTLEKSAKDLQDTQVGMEIDKAAEVPIEGVNHADM